MVRCLWAFAAGWIAAIAVTTVLLAHVMMVAALALVAVAVAAYRAGRRRAARPARTAIMSSSPGPVDGAAVARVADLEAENAVLRQEAAEAIREPPPGARRLASDQQPASYDHEMCRRLLVDPRSGACDLSGGGG